MVHVIRLNNRTLTHMRPTNLGGFERIRTAGVTCVFEFIELIQHLAFFLLHTQRTTQHAALVTVRTIMSAFEDDFVLWAQSRKSFFLFIF